MYRNHAAPSYRRQHSSHCVHPSDSQDEEPFRECKTGCGFFRYECQFATLRAGLQGLRAVCLSCRTKRGRHNANARNRDRMPVGSEENAAARSRSASPSRLVAAVAASSDAVHQLPQSMIDIVNGCIAKPRHSLVIHQVRPVIRVDISQFLFGSHLFAWYSWSPAFAVLLFDCFYFPVAI